jgi:hypothetical protein
VEDAPSNFKTKTTHAQVYEISKKGNFKNQHVALEVKLSWLNINEPKIVTCNTYNSKIGDGQGVYDIPSHTIYIYSPDILYNRTLHHERVHAKHHSYKVVRALFFRKIPFFLGLAAVIIIQFLTSFFVAAIVLFFIFALSLLEEFYTQHKTRKWFKNFLQKAAEKEWGGEKSTIRIEYAKKFNHLNS